MKNKEKINQSKNSSGINRGALIILSLVMVVNALSYGIIIPLIYPYVSRFGLNPTSFGFLFASYSLFQFLATPLIGRLSDRYGRKPLLLMSLFGTSVSLAVFASAGGVFQLFLARILDGITGGNMSVAQAVIADSVKSKERAKYFGILGASFGFGFLIGPALGGLLGQISLTAPFWAASALALVGTLLGFFFLPETRSRQNEVVQKKEPLIDFKNLWRALFKPLTGIILLITLTSAVAQNAFSIGFQSFTVDVLKYTPVQVGLIFTAFGLVNLLMQGVGIGLLLKKFSLKTLLMVSMLVSTVLTGLMGFAQVSIVFLVFMVAFMFVPPSMPFLSAMISERTNPEDQGGVLGLRQSYMSLGQIIGPILAGLVASIYIPAIFWAVAIMFGVSFWLSRKVTDVEVSNKLDL
jgi:multidrug resistance protein